MKASDAMATIEEMAAALAQRYQSKKFDLGSGIVLTVRELSQAEKKKLDQRLFECDDYGKPLLFDKDDKLTTAGEGWQHFKPGVDVRREWLLATLTPVEAVDVVLSDSTPDSFKRELVDTARRLSGLTVQEAAGN